MIGRTGTPVRTRVVCGRIVLGIIAWLLTVAEATALTPLPFVNVLDFGAKCDGVSNDTSAFTTALAASAFVVVPASPSGCVVTGVSVPLGAELHLVPGARLLTSGAISLQSSRARLIGHTGALGSTASVDQGGANILWTGPPTTGAIQVGTVTGSSPTGVTISGIWVDGGGVSGVRALDVGVPGGGPAWLTVRTFVATRVQHGIRIVDGTQQSTFDDLHFNNAVTSPGTGIEISGSGVSAITTLWFDRFTVQGYGTGVLVTGRVGAVSVEFSRFVVEGNTVAEFDLQAGANLTLHSGHIESTAPRAIRMGSPSGWVDSVRIYGNEIQGLGALIEGIGWRNFDIFANRLDGGGQAQAFVNTGGGQSRYGGRWHDNHIGSAGVAAELVGGLTGIDMFSVERIGSPTAAPQPVWQVTAPVAKVTTAVAQSMATAVLTSIQFESVAFDTYAMHDPVNPSRVTVPIAGKYRLTGWLEFGQQSTVGSRMIAFSLNGGVGQQVWMDANKNSATELTRVDVWPMAAGDSVQLLAYQTSGGNLSVYAAYLIVEYVGP